MNSELTVHNARTSADSPPGSPGRSLTVETVQTFEGLLSLDKAWEALTMNSSSTIYQSFEWVSQWWKHLGDEPSHRLHVLLFRDEDQLVGIAPLFLKQYTLLGMRVHRQLCFLGCGTAHTQSGGIFFDDGPSDYLDIIALPEYEEEVSNAFIAYFQRSSHVFDELKGVNLAEDSCMMRVTVPLFLANRINSTMKIADMYARFNIPDSFDEYLQSCSVNVRRRITQTRKAFLKGESYTVRTVHSQEDFHRAFRCLTFLHQRRWNKIGYLGFFADLPYKRFQEELGQLLLRKGLLWFKTAQVGDSCVAARLGFLFNGRLYDYLSGFDDTSPTAKNRPSLALLINMIEDAMEKNIAVVDLLRGNEKYKFDFTSSFEHNWNITLAKPEKRITLRNMLYQLVLIYQVFGFIFNREFRLLRVQSRQHVFPLFLYHYFVFRGVRLFTKLVVLYKRPRSDSSKTPPMNGRNRNGSSPDV